MNKEKVIIEAQRIPSHFNYDWLKLRSCGKVFISPDKIPVNVSILNCILFSRVRVTQSMYVVVGPSTFDNTI